MDLTPKQTSEYYIVFGKSKLNHWVMKLLDAHFQHCYAVKLSPGKTFWIIVDPKRGFTDIFLQPVDKYPTIRALVGSDKTVLNVKAYLTEAKRDRFCVFNCVEVVKSLIGLNKFFIFTPKQLYKYLAGA